MRTVRLLTALFAAALLTVTLVGCPPHKPMATQVKVVPSKTILAPQEAFTVDIIVDPTVDIAGAQFELHWDPAALRVDQVAEGNLFKQTGKQTMFNGGVIDNDGGSLTKVWGVILGAGNSVNASGTLATLFCTALTAGKTSMFTLADVVVGDVSGTAVPLASSIINQIQVALDWDYNFDGQVDANDVAVAGALFGAIGQYREDANADGKINVLDIILVAQHIV
jgi:hypothetical protein